MELFLDAGTERIDRRDRDVEFLGDLFDALMQSLPVHVPADAEYGCLLDGLRGEAYFQDYHQPVHPAVIEHFGLEWCRADMEYNYHNRARWDFAEFMARYINYDRMEPV